MTYIYPLGALTLATGGLSVFVLSRALNTLAEEGLAAAAGGLAESFAFFLTFLVTLGVVLVVMTVEAIDRRK